MTQNKEAIKPESSITSLLSDYKKIFSLLSQTSGNKMNQNTSLRSDWIYWVYNQTYLLCLKLFERFIRYLRKKEIDETGIYRLEVTLTTIQTEFESFLKQAKKQMEIDDQMREVEKMIEFCEQQNSLQYLHAKFVI